MIPTPQLQSFPLLPDSDTSSESTPLLSSLSVVETPEHTAQGGMMCTVIAGAVGLALTASGALMMEMGEESCFADGQVVSDSQNGLTECGSGLLLVVSGLIVTTASVVRALKHCYDRAFCSSSRTDTQAQAQTQTQSAVVEID